MVSQPGANSRQFIAAGTMNERTSFQRSGMRESGFFKNADPWKIDPP
jgi:hypothetical protein